MSPESALIAEIPVLVRRSARAGRRPLVLLSHGFTRCKEDWLEKLDELAGNGYFAVAMDNRLHGERAGAGFASLMPGGKLDLVSLRKVMGETASDISLLLDHFCADPAVDPQRIALAGVSMGGFVTYAALANDARISVAVPIIASPYWGDIPGDSDVALSAESQAELESLAARAEPAARMEMFPPRALLGQIGDIDTHYNGERVKRFFDMLRPLYGSDSDRARLIVHPGVAHDFTAEMWANALAWFETYL